MQETNSFLADYGVFERFYECSCPRVVNLFKYVFLIVKNITSLVRRHVNFVCTIFCPYLLVFNCVAYLLLNLNLHLCFVVSLMELASTCLTWGLIH